MPSVLNTIYAAFCGLFTEEVLPPAATGLTFRFSRRPLVIADSDFVAPGHANFGVSSQMAAEVFSRYTDLVPVLDTNGISVSFGNLTISDLFRDEIIVPAVASGQTFTRIKAEALKRMEMARAASLTGGPGSHFFRSEATPTSWWDRTAPGGWSAHSVSLKLDLPRGDPGFFDSIVGFLRGRDVADGVEAILEFEYCTVRIGRPWLYRPVLLSSEFYIPGMRRGELSANDGRGIPSIPVAMVAIRNLSILAPWTVSRIDSHVGDRVVPFRLRGDVVNGSVSEERTQIVGWILENVRVLPPVDDPAFRKPFDEPPRESTSRAETAASSAQPGSTSRSRPVVISGTPWPTSRHDTMLTFAQPWWSTAPAPREGRPLWNVERVAGADLNRAVTEADGGVVIFFSARWAGHSRRAEPVVALLAREFGRSIRFIEVETEESEKLLEGNGTTTVPAFLLRSEGSWKKLFGLEPGVLISHVKQMAAAAESGLSRTDHGFLIGVPRLSEATFLKEIAGHESVVVFFWTSSSDRAQVMSATVEGMAAVCVRAFRTYEVDISTEKALAQRYGVEGADFVLIRFVRGQEVRRFLGDGGWEAVLSALQAPGERAWRRAGIDREQQWGPPEDGGIVGRVLGFINEHMEGLDEGSITTRMIVEGGFCGGSLSSATWEAWSQMSRAADAPIPARVLGLTRKDADAISSRVYELHEQGRSVLAEVAFRALVVMNPRDSYMRLVLGSALQGLGRHSEAIAQYGHSIALQPNNIASYTNRGELLLFVGKFDEALEDLKTAVKLDPMNEAPHGRRARALISAVAKILRRVVEERNGGES